MVASNLTLRYLKYNKLLEKKKKDKNHIFNKHEYLFFQDFIQYKIRIDASFEIYELRIFFKESISKYKNNDNMSTCNIFIFILDILKDLKNIVYYSSLYDDINEDYYLLMKNNNIHSKRLEKHKILMKLVKEHNSKPEMTLRYTKIYP